MPTTEFKTLENATTALEAALWAEQRFSEDLLAYQQHFQKIESAYAQQKHDPRHDFIIVIPVADRPQHLQSCLNSILEQQKNYHYGQGKKIKILIADDSKASAAIQQHQQISNDFRQQGLNIEYFGQSQQRQLLKNLPTELSAIVGKADAANFHHKGASITRNILYLRLNQLKTERSLFYFIDSDQEFNTLISTHKNKLNAINFFYHLDQIFRQNDIEVLTGKVVGDPPVSPAVMAANFLDDVNAFLSQIAEYEPDNACQFHQQNQDDNNAAAYHDMADLFGFKHKKSHFNYPCKLTGNHTNQDCLHDFTQKLNHFFDGEHPTRKSYFSYQAPSKLNPARTIYTGNYIFKPSALRYFIPFAALKLRMAGPVLGRIIQAEIGQKFVSSNLPMLHQRTVTELGVSEFRAGVTHQAKLIDLSLEFERQYFGDVMLFSIEKLTQQGFPTQSFQLNDVSSVVATIEADLLQKYLLKQQQIAQKLQTLTALFSQDKCWQTMLAACQQIQVFINNIQHNFKPQAHSYQLIQKHKAQRLQAISQAIVAYPDLQQKWQTHLNLRKT